MLLPKRLTVLRRGSGSLRWRSAALRRKSAVLHALSMVLSKWGTGLHAWSVALARRRMFMAHNEVGRCRQRRASSRPTTRAVGRNDGCRCEIRGVSWKATMAVAGTSDVAPWEATTYVLGRNDPAVVANDGARGEQRRVPWRATNGVVASNHRRRGRQRRVSLWAMKMSLQCRAVFLVLPSKGSPDVIVRVILIRIARCRWPEGPPIAESWSISPPRS
jgi:hypothetical protein